MSKIYETVYKTLPTEECCKENRKPSESFGFGARHIQVVIIFLSLAVGFVARGHLGITIVAMTDTAKPDWVLNTVESTFGNETNLDDAEIGRVVSLKNDAVNESKIFADDNITDLAIKKNFVEISSVYKTYNWKKSVQEMVLSAFFLGYCMMMFPMGMVVQRWGGKVPIQIALLINGVVSILTPHLAAWGGWKAVCACRIMQGLSQAGFYPSIQILIAKWAPISERGRLSSFAYMGSVFGTILAFQIGGTLSATSWGWPANFWATGLLCLIMLVIVSLFTAPTPLDHKSISEEELKFILGKGDSRIKKTPKVPWTALLSTRAVWASISAHVGSGLSFVFFFIQVPTYIHYILGVDVKSSGLLSSLPYIGGFTTSVFFGILSDYGTNHKIVTIKSARRISNSIAHFGLATSLIMVSFTKNVSLAVCCLVLALSTNAGVHTGWMVNHIDLAPNYTGTLMAIGNTVTSLGYFIIPVLISFVVTDVTNQYQWRIVFLFVAGIAIVTNTIFVTFMSSETQPWNDGSTEKTENSKDKEADAEIKLIIRK